MEKEIKSNVREFINHCLRQYIDCGFCRCKGVEVIKCQGNCVDKILKLLGFENE